LDARERRNRGEDKEKKKKKKINRDSFLLLHLRFRLSTLLALGQGRKPRRLNRQKTWRELATLICLRATDYAGTMSRKWQGENALPFGGQTDSIDLLDWRGVLRGGEERINCQRLVGM
jgi:hypothetical protein